MELLKNLKKQRAELDKKIETLEYAERVFEEGDQIWFVDHFGNVECGKWGNFAWVDGAFNQGHIFRTKKEAETEAKRRNLLTRFRSFRDECNDRWKPDWNNEDKKWNIRYMENSFLTELAFESNSFSTFGCFKNEEDAQRAIDLFGDEIKELFVDCEECEW
ncbi:MULTISPECIES: hypothetical protein [unclassified Granulicatella]|uniref:hypothetical protein n=1 Tax=unclassified Granulicatella TaxID=2630493 RepID=UPI00066BFE24|nr:MULTISPECIES: hypothetical protein [unclassified Granulicatella]DAS17429.1 MAG TPA: hypothetical protein [Caudoviricetes sp.]